MNKRLKKLPEEILGKLTKEDFTLLDCLILNAENKLLVIAETFQSIKQTVMDRLEINILMQHLEENVNETVVAMHFPIEYSFLKNMKIYIDVIYDEMMECERLIDMKPRNYGRLINGVGETAMNVAIRQGLRFLLKEKNALEPEEFIDLYNKLNSLTKYKKQIHPLEDFMCEYEARLREQQATTQLEEVAKNNAMLEQRRRLEEEQKLREEQMQRKEARKLRKEEDEKNKEIANSRTERIKTMGRQLTLVSQFLDDCLFAKEKGVEFNSSADVLDRCVRRLFKDRKFDPFTFVLRERGEPVFDEEGFYVVNPDISEKDLKTFENKINSSRFDVEKLMPIYYGKEMRDCMCKR